MPTHYKRKVNKTRGNCTQQDLENALESVRKGTSGVNEASRNSDIPCTTIRRRLKTGNIFKGSLGPPCFSPTRKAVREIAFKLANQLGIPHRFNRTMGISGTDWLNLFLERNRDLFVLEPEGVSLARIQNMNRKIVSDYFKLLEDILIENNLLNNPASIYYKDESGLHLNNKPEEVIAKRDSKNVAAVTSGKKGETITIISCCNSEGSFLPPAKMKKED
ncbi:hypothetical protein ILUMI_21434 [Ignelater luminosus]|uniref:HTH psq-type domain-containing protein n=1 Tax=Ignelater luminosus TaxID=2038154 RepID=A0A8K0CCE4_IGNLU|nr:hypothetical protein ILUMI_21434 [Ignelater luminosus]